MARTVQAKFIPPMLLLKSDRLPDDPRWTYELKLDGYRAIAFKREGKVQLRSRNDKEFATRYPAVVKALANLPNETVVDGEVVGFDENGRPSFNTLQNFGPSPVYGRSDRVLFATWTASYPRPADYETPARRKWADLGGR